MVISTGGGGQLFLPPTVYRWKLDFWTKVEWFRFVRIHFRFLPGLAWNCLAWNEIVRHSLRWDFFGCWFSCDKNTKTVAFLWKFRFQFFFPKQLCFSKRFSFQNRTQKSCVDPCNLAPQAKFFEIWDSKITFHPCNLAPLICECYMFMYLFRLSVYIFVFKKSLVFDFCHNLSFL